MNVRRCVRSYLIRSLAVILDVTQGSFKCVTTKPTAKSAATSLTLVYIFIHCLWQCSYCKGCLDRFVACDKATTQIVSCKI